MLTVHLIMEPNKSHKAYTSVRGASFNEDYAEFTFTQEQLVNSPQCHSVLYKYNAKDLYMVTVYDGPTKLFEVAPGMHRR